MTNEAPPPMGDNNPPPYRESVVEAHSAKAAEFLDAAGEWLDLKEIETPEKASELTDFITGLRARYKSCDEDRKSDKKPFDDAGKAVQGAYVPILDKLKKAEDRVTPMQSAWLEKLDRQAKAEAARQAAEARAAQEEADRLAAAAASRNDIAGEAEAEAAAKKAAEMQKDAARAAKAKPQSRSASGGGRTTSLRPIVTAKLKNPRVAMMHFQDNTELHALLEQLATRAARAKGFDPKTDKIPGFDISVERKAV